MEKEEALWSEEVRIMKYFTKEKLLDFALYCTITLVCVLMVFVSQYLMAQPLKNAEEIVFEIHDVHLYHETGDFAKYMDDIKISASIVSGKLGDFQTSAVFKEPNFSFCTRTEK